MQVRCERCGFHPWIRNIPWRRPQRPTLVFLPGESHGRRSRVGYSPWGCKDLDRTEATKQAHIPFGNILLNVLSADDNHCANCKRVHCAPRVQHLRRRNKGSQSTAVLLAGRHWVIQWPQWWASKYQLSVSGTCECYLQWESFTGVVTLRMVRWRNSAGLPGWVLIAILCVLIRDRQRRIRQTEAEKSVETRQTQRLAWCGSKAGKLAAPRSFKRQRTDSLFYATAYYLLTHFVLINSII